MQETHPDHDDVSLERSSFFNSLLDLANASRRTGFGPISSMSEYSASGFAIHHRFALPSHRRGRGSFRRWIFGEIPEASRIGNDQIRDLVRYIQQIPIAGHKNIGLGCQGGCQNPPIIFVTDGNRRDGFGLGCTVWFSRKARISSLRSGGNFNFRWRTLSTSFMTTSPMTSSCSARTRRITSAQSPRVANPLTNTLVSRKTFTTPF